MMGLVLASDPAQDAGTVALLLVAEDAQDALPDLAGFLAGVNTFPDAGLAIVVDHRGGLGVVSTEALLQCVRVIVAALDEGLASNVILHVLLGRVEGGVVRSAGRRVDKATGDAGDEERIVDLQLDGVLQLLLALRKHGIEALRLGNGARETVENESAQGYEYQHVKSQNNNFIAQRN